ncbi:hypothetical protein T439DRAFT_321545 [Meredithblackwellia eburnea MCA 4105]
MMIRLLALVLPTSLVLSISVSALSSHSPQDLFAFPQFQVRLDGPAILNDSLSEILASQSSSGDNEGETLHLMRTPAGQAFLCSVPLTTQAPPPPPTSEDLEKRLVEREKGLERGLDLLDNMRGSCLYQKQGYFTYSFCYGNEIRQFHEVRISGSPGPSEDPNADSYTLGQSPLPIPSPTPPHSIQQPKYGSGSGLVKGNPPPPSHNDDNAGEGRIPATLGGGMDDAGFGGWDDGGRYLSQKWEGGTVCDKTGLPRSVEVQFHCNTNAGDSIALIRETAICTYVMLIHTPRLCSEPIFLEGTQGSQEPPAVIQCRPIVKKIREGVEAGASTGPGAGDGTEETLDVGMGDQEGQEAAKEEQQPPKVEEGKSSSSSSDTPVSTASDIRLEALLEDPNHGLLGLDTVTLIYDPETGIIHSAEADGEEIFLDSASSTSTGSEEEGEGKQKEKGEKERIDDLSDLARIMKKSLTDALKQHGDRVGRGEGRDGEGRLAQGAEEEDIVVPGGVAVGGLDGLLDAINRGIQRSSTAEGESEEKRGGKGSDDPLDKLLSQVGMSDFVTQVRTIVEAKRALLAQAQAGEVDEDSETERLRRGFERRWDEEGNEVKEDASEKAKKERESYRLKKEEYVRRVPLRDAPVREPRARDEL